MLKEYIRWIWHWWPVRIFRKLILILLYPFWMILKWLWCFKIIRIFTGIISILTGIVIGIFIGLWPGPSGSIPFAFGLIVLFKELPWLREWTEAFLLILLEKFPFLRKVIAFGLYFIRKLLPTRKFLKWLKVLIYKHTGWRLYFKKRKRRKK